ncbi:MAG: hypothetical protein AAFO87_04950, partial [Cyanobacteria bacterium J06607_6]
QLFLFFFELDGQTYRLLIKLEEKEKELVSLPEPAEAEVVQEMALSQPEAAVQELALPQPEAESRAPQVVPQPLPLEESELD